MGSQKYYILIIALLLFSCGTRKSVQDRPDLSHYNNQIPQRVAINDSTYIAGDNFLLKNEHGLWELYVEGDPLQIGLLTGSLTEELFHNQEKAFLSNVEKIVSSNTKQLLLKKFLVWYNRKMYLHIPEEYKAEIYGLSRFASPENNDVAPPYLRMLYLHGAHDIGHALQDLALVGCSSFAAWGEKTEDGKLLIGRNLDFYVGDEFSKQKIIAFIKPDRGYPFMSVTWAGMIGVVSGMNNQGLTVTINAGKSDIPLVAKTPISLVAREILQHASTIEEAMEIARKREVFVSESIMVGSAKEKTAALIEVSPENFGVFKIENSNQLICTNHFQSEAYADDPNNTATIKNSHSMYRYERLNELLAEETKINAEEAVDILRNREGKDGKSLGYGNEKALNQLLAHHGIVFKPEENLVWVSANPYQLGAFVAYDLDEIFQNENFQNQKQSISEEELLIAEDPFIYSQEFKDYEEYRMLERQVEQAIEENTALSPDFINKFQSKNPDFWKAYFLIGKYYYQKKYYAAALFQFEKSLEKEVTTLVDEELIELYIRKINRKLHR